VELIGVRRFLRRHLTPEQRRVIKFLVVGASGVPVNVGVVWLCTVVLDPARFEGIRAMASDLLGVATLTATGLRDMASYGIGILVSIFTNFVLNHYWTWGDRVVGDDRGRFLKRLAKFYLVSSVAATVQLGTSSLVSALARGNEFFNASIHGDFRVYHAVAPMVGILAGMTINFVVNNWWTFRKKA
jgi:putative flippase GtrA